MSKHELIICIVNHGFTDLVMESARSAGARGGTVFSGRGTGDKDMEKLFGVVITPEKEVVLILVEESIRDAVLKKINEGAGIATKGQGIAFSIPVSDVVGLSESAKPESASHGEDATIASVNQDGGEQEEESRRTE